MNNLSYCGLVDTKIRAKDKDLPVCNDCTCVTLVRNELCVPFVYINRTLIFNMGLCSLVFNIQDPAPQISFDMYINNECIKGHLKFVGKL